MIVSLGAHFNLDQKVQVRGPMSMIAYSPKTTLSYTIGAIYPFQGRERMMRRPICDVHFHNAQLGSIFYINVKILEHFKHIV